MGVSARRDVIWVGSARYASGQGATAIMRSVDVRGRLDCGCRTSPDASIAGPPELGGVACSAETDGFPLTTQVGRHGYQGEGCCGTIYSLRSYLRSGVLQILASAPKSTSTHPSPVSDDGGVARKSCRIRAAINPSTLILRLSVHDDGSAET